MTTIRADVTKRLRIDAEFQEEHALDETGGSLITARLEREAAFEIENQRREQALAFRRIRQLSKALEKARAQLLDMEKSRRIF